VYSLVVVANSVVSTSAVDYQERLVSYRFSKDTSNSADKPFGGCILTYDDVWPTVGMQTWVCGIGNWPITNLGVAYS